MNIKLSVTNMLVFTIFMILVLYIVLFLFNLSFYEATTMQFEDLKRIVVEIRNDNKELCRR